MNADKLITTLSLFCLLVTSRAEVPTGWRTNLADTMKFAASTNRPVLLYFTADWCGPCRQMARATLPDPTVVNLLGEFAPVALDLDVHREVAAERNVSAIPAFLILTPEGEEVTRSTGYLDADRFQRFLTAGLVASDVARDRGDEFKRIQEEILVGLKDGSPESRRRVMGQLLRLSADVEARRQKFAREQFAALALVAPGELLAGLEHPQLAVRLAVANALRDRLGETFEFDPWAGAEERAAALGQLRTVMKR